MKRPRKLPSDEQTNKRLRDAGRSSSVKQRRKGSVKLHHLLTDGEQEESAHLKLIAGALPDPSTDHLGLLSSAMASAVHLQTQTLNLAVLLSVFLSVASAPLCETAVRLWTVLIRPRDLRTPMTRTSRSSEEGSALHRHRTAGVDLPHDHHRQSRIHALRGGCHLRGASIATRHPTVLLDWRAVYRTEWNLGLLLPSPCLAARCVPCHVAPEADVEATTERVSNGSCFTV